MEDMKKGTIIKEKAENIKAGRSIKPKEKNIPNIGVFIK